MNKVVKQYQDMSRMMKKLGGKSGAAAMKAMMGGGMPSVGGASGVMPDMDALSKGIGKLPNMPGMPGGLPSGLPGLGGKSSGKKK